MRLFISYAHEDEALVEELVDLLRAGSHDAWFDHRLLPGQDWKRQLKEAIRRCDAFVYTLTPASVESEWCQWEFSQAVQLGKPVIPVLLKAGTPIPQVLRRYQYADFSQGATPHVVAKLMGGLMNVAVTISPKNTPRAPENPRGLPAQATREMHRVRPQSSRRRLSMTLLVVIVLLGAVFFVATQTGFNPLAPQPTPSPTPSAADYLAEGYTYVENGDYEAAYHSFSSAIALEPEFTDAYLARADLWWALGDTIQQAVDDYGLVLGYITDNAEIYYKLGSVYFYGLGDYDNAIINLSAALDLDTYYTDAYLLRGDVYSAQANTDAALQDYTTAIEQSPDYAQAYVSRAAFYIATGDTGSALNDLSQAIEKDPAYAPAYVTRGNIYYDQGEYPLALNDYDQYLGLVGADNDPDIQARADELRAQLGQ